MGEKKMSSAYGLRRFSNCDTSGTNTYYDPFYEPRPRYWAQEPKHCGGVTECGKVCHKGMNCTIVDQYEKDGKTVYKYYCRKCKEFGEGETGDCKQ